ncbi:50S ribosomal protein L9 [Candidatus Deianiraea vastatrix]|uniref:Large ribosomal subunit protein bL9 n=1 Tax=Candidatus Deianiraea vastatrix TaxID=2163644 RepID=A0A5B8XGZ7_9RICK|nr:50S ribosomal protein L9 [Candidatus Deianiraea vastatrix]QED23421.1 50S ribosomal protein L9 [Candidatus Deianiraea vastatrix]
MIKVVLLKSVNQLGSVGSVVLVKPGYAKNYLVPQGIALFANKAILEKMDFNKKKLLEADSVNAKKAAQIASISQNIMLDVSKKTFQDVKIHGSVSSKEVAILLSQEIKKIINQQASDKDLSISESDIDSYISPSSIKFFTSIKEIGEYKISVTVYGDVKFDCIVNVVKE